MQIGWNITNNFGTPPGKGGGGGFWLFLVGAVAVVAVLAMVVVPAVVATTSLLAALLPLLMWGAIGIGGTVLGVGALVGGHKALKAARINQDNAARFRQRQAAAKLTPAQREALTGRTVYVAAEREIEQTRVSRIS